jgi:very-short-patch-repair endonuclease
VPSEVVERAQYLRSNMTGVERRLWSRVRAKQLGVKFRRQHPIGPYIADFACVSARLVVELDGDTHSDAYDDRRDHWMKSCGWRVMRVYLNEVDDELDAVVAAIELELEQPGSMLDWAQRTGQPSVYRAGVIVTSPAGLPASGKETSPPGLPASGEEKAGPASRRPTALE